MPTTPAKDAAAAKLRSARRNNPDAFICQAGRVVTNPALCEHCGQTSSGVCGELPAVMERTAEAASTMLAALKAWQTFGATRPSAGDLANGCTIPIKEFRRAQELMSEAFDAAEAAGITAKTEE